MEHHMNIRLDTYAFSQFSTKGALTPVIAFAANAEGLGPNVVPLKVLWLTLHA